MQLILITQRNRKVNKCNVSYCEVLLFLQRNFMLNPVRLPKHTYTQRACDRWQILLKRCYVHKSFAPAWGEAANRSRRTIEPVSAWAAPRWETIRLQAAESRYDKLCVLSQSLVCVCVLSLSHHFRDQPIEITEMLMAHWWVLQRGLPAKIKSNLSYYVCVIQKFTEKQLLSSWACANSNLDEK